MKKNKKLLKADGWWEKLANMLGLKIYVLISRRYLFIFLMKNNKI